MSGFTSTPPDDAVPDNPPGEAPDPHDRAADGIGARAFPWPPRGGESVLDAWGRTWSGAALGPRRFFAAMAREGSPGPAILYYLSIGIPVAGVQLFWTMLRGGGEEATGLGVGEWGPLIDFLFSPILLMLSLILSAGVVHLMLKLFGAAAGDYWLTTRVFAFAYSPQILGVIPVAGSIAGFIWMVAVAIIGVREAHRTTTGRAAAAILIPLAIAFAFVLAAELIVRAGGLLDLEV